MTHVRLFPWVHYSPKLKTRILAQCSSGVIDQSREGMRLVTAVGSDRNEGHQCKLFLLVSEDDGEIIDAKYQAFGPSALIGALEVLCEVVLRKNYDQAKRISAELIDKQVQTTAKKSAFPLEAYPQINFALEILDKALEECGDIRLPEGYVVTPVRLDELEEGEYPDWAPLTKEERLAIIRTVIENDIQPYIELDEGGVKIIDLRGDVEVVIQYSGSCTSCYAATGSTLTAIQQILRKKVHPGITVIPQL